MGIATSELHTSQQKIEICNKDYWAKLRVMSDSDGVQYYDVLAGERHKRPHMHMGISLLGESIFALDRGVVTAVARETESRLYGKYPKEELRLKENPGKCEVTVRVKIDGPSKESAIDVFELKSIP